MELKKKLLVSLSGGTPWGFRLSGGAGTGVPLVVSKVRRKSKSYKHLFEGDLVISVNDQSCQSLSYDQVMEIAEKSGDDITLEIMRQELNKENIAPSPAEVDKRSSTINPNKELISSTESTKKTIDIHEDMTIKSAKMLPDVVSCPAKNGSLTSQNTNQQAQVKAASPFPQGPPKPPRSPDVLAGNLADMSTSSKSEEIAREGDTLIKTKTESRHEVKGNTETSFKMTEKESVSKSSDPISKSALESMDLNQLINETQKTIESFNTGFKPQESTSLHSSTGFKFQKPSDFRSKIGFKSQDVPDFLAKPSDFLNKQTFKTHESSNVCLEETKKVKEIISTTESTKQETLNFLSQPFSNPDLECLLKDKPFLSGKTETFKTSTPFTSKNVDSSRKETLSSSSFNTVSNSGNFVPPSLDALAKDGSKQNDIEMSAPPPPPPPPKPKMRPMSDPLFKGFNDCLNEMQMDRCTMNGGLGFNSNESESSYITTDTPFGTTIITKKKKMFSSSSFYEEPQAIYPTIEEQVEMARKIADSLADDTNRKSKGANMFFKRVKRSSKWIHEGPEPSDDSGPGSPEIQGIEPPTPDPSIVPFRPSKNPPKLKLLLDPRHPLDANALRSSGMVINEHNTVSPEICHHIVKDLLSPTGKGAALFAKRKKKSEEWVVDEEKVNALLMKQQQKTNVVPPPIQPSYGPYTAFSHQPFGRGVHPDELADTVIRAADSKLQQCTLTREPSRLEGCLSPTPSLPMTQAAAHYDIYHAKAPKGWTGFGSRDTSVYEPPTPVYTTPTTAALHLASQDSQFALRNMNFKDFNTLPRGFKKSW